MTSRLSARIAALLLVGVVAAGCGSSSSSSQPTAATRVPEVCSSGDVPPAQYQSVVVFAFENRSWPEVGRGFGEEMPYLHALGKQCAFFSDWSEIDPDQSSLTQYVGQITGVRGQRTVDDCDPSSRCSTRADNLFRQLRQRGRRGINFVEGATKPCTAGANVKRHIPPLYLWGADDRAFCRQEVRPLRELDVDALPSFAFVTPTLCNDGHDCGNAHVDDWARDHVQPILDSPAYRAGKVAVFIWYDEDRPVPNLWITPTASAGARSVRGAGAAGTLRAWQSMLGLECLAAACRAPDLRTAARS